MENIKVSVIVPIYNVEKYLEECLESLVNQTLSGIEIIMVIDGSTDGSEMIARRYVETFDNFKMIIQENQGLSGARNTGLRIAQGKYVYFVDSDDYISLNAMEILYNTAEEKNVEVVLFDADVFLDGIEKYDYTHMENVNYYDRPNDYTDVLSGQEMFCRLYNNGHYRAPAWISFTERNFLLRVGLEFFVGIIHEDELYTFQLLFYANKVTHINEKLFHRRLRKSSIMTSSSAIKHFEGCYWTVYTLKEKFDSGLMNQEMRNLFNRFINENLVIALNWYADLSFTERKRLRNKFKQLGKYAKEDSYTKKLYILLWISPVSYKMIRTIKRYICDWGKKEFYAE